MKMMSGVALSEKMSLFRSVRGLFERNDQQVLSAPWTNGDFLLVRRAPLFAIVPHHQLRPVHGSRNYTDEGVTADMLV